MSRNLQETRVDMDPAYSSDAEDDFLADDYVEVNGDDDPDNRASDVDFDDVLDALRSDIVGALLKARAHCDAVGHPYCITTVIALNQVMERAVWDLGPSDLARALRRWLNRVKRRGPVDALHPVLLEYEYRFDEGGDEASSEPQEASPEVVGGRKTSDDDDEEEEGY